MELFPSSWEVVGMFVGLGLMSAKERVGDDGTAEFHE